MECHRCEHREAVRAGKYARVAFQDTPCAKCELKENSEFTMAYDEERETAKSVTGGQWTLDETQNPDAGSEDEERLPISVMREIVAALLTMPTEIRDAVCWRYAGFKYQDVAKVQNVTMAAVEVRHTRALRRWPVLQALFPAKVARQARRRRKGEVRSPKAEVSREEVNSKDSEQ